MKTLFLKLSKAAMLLATMLLISCDNQLNDKGEYVIKPNKLSEEVRIKYNNKGNIDYIQEYADGIPSGLFMNFKRGNLKDISTIKDDKNNGCGVVFHSKVSYRANGNCTCDLG